MGASRSRRREASAALMRANSARMRARCCCSLDSPPPSADDDGESDAEGSCCCCCLLTSDRWLCGASDEESLLGREDSSSYGEIDEMKGGGTVPLMAPVMAREEDADAAMTSPGDRLWLLGGSFWDLTCTDVVLAGSLDFGGDGFSFKKL